MATANDVAKYILSLSDEEAGDTISNLKLQKLLYYAQGFHLACFDEPLFEDPIVAWRHGPAIRHIYAQYADYGRRDIPPPNDFDINCIGEEARELIDEVYRIYGQYSAWRLRDMTHEEPPWRETWRDDGIEREITHQSLHEYFMTLVEDDG